MSDPANAEPAAIAKLDAAFALEQMDTIRETFRAAREGRRPPIVGTELGRLNAAYQEALERARFAHGQQGTVVRFEWLPPAAMTLEMAEVSLATAMARMLEDLGEDETLRRVALAIAKAKAGSSGPPRPVPIPPAEDQP